MTNRGDDRLKGKTAIVTGAGSRAEGIGNGRAIAIILARHGARVTLVTRWRNGRRHQEAYRCRKRYGANRRGRR